MLARNPNKLNILYSVLMKPSDTLTIFRPFINDLKVSKTSENFFASRTYNYASNLCAGHHKCPKFTMTTTFFSSVICFFQLEMSNIIFFRTNWLLFHLHS